MGIYSSHFLNMFHSLKTLKLLLLKKMQQRHSLFQRELKKKKKQNIFCLVMSSSPTSRQVISFLCLTFLASKISNFIIYSKTQQRRKKRGGGKTQNPLRVSYNHRTPGTGNFKRTTKKRTNTFANRMRPIIKLSELAAP